MIENAGYTVLRIVDFQISWGSMPLDPLRCPFGTQTSPPISVLSPPTVPHLLGRTLRVPVSRPGGVEDSHSLLTLQQLQKKTQKTSFRIQRVQTLKSRTWKAGFINNTLNCVYITATIIYNIVQIQAVLNFKKF